MTRPRPGTRGLSAWQLEAFAVDIPYGAECAPAQLALPAELAGEHDRVQPSPAAAFDAEARATADRIRAEVTARRCKCELPPEQIVDGRCSRCWGRQPSRDGTLVHRADTRQVLQADPSGGDR